MKKQGEITFIVRKGYATIKIYRVGETSVPVSTMEKWERLQKLKGEFRTGRKVEAAKREEQKIIATARESIAIKHYDVAQAEKEELLSLTPKTLEGKRRQKIKVRKWFARQERASEARIQALRDREVLRSSPFRWKEREEREKKKRGAYETKAYKWNHKELPMGKNRYCHFPITIVQRIEYKQWQEAKAILRAFDKKHEGVELLRAEKKAHKRRVDEVETMQKALYKKRIIGSCFYREKPGKEESEENEYLQYHNPYTK